MCSARRNNLKVGWDLHISKVQQDSNDLCKEIQRSLSLNTFINATFHSLKTTVLSCWRPGGTFKCWLGYPYKVVITYNLPLLVGTGLRQDPRDGWNEFQELSPYVPPGLKHHRVHFHLFYHLILSYFLSLRLISYFTLEIQVRINN